MFPRGDFWSSAVTPLAPSKWSAKIQCSTELSTGIASSTCTNLLDTRYFLRQEVGTLFLSCPGHGSRGINVGGPRVFTQVTAVINLVNIQLTRTMIMFTGLSGSWSPRAVLCMFSTRRKTWLSQIKQKEPNVQGGFGSPSQPRVHPVRHLPGTQ